LFYYHAQKAIFAHKDLRGLRSAIFLAQEVGEELGGSEVLQPTMPFE
jgi:hypothetical protein